MENVHSEYKLRSQNHKQCVQRVSEEKKNVYEQICLRSLKRITCDRLEKATWLLETGVTVLFTDKDTSPCQSVQGDSL